MTYQSSHESNFIDLRNYDKLLLAGDGWQLSFVDVTDDDESETYAVGVIAIDRNAQRALFAIQYDFFLTDGQITVQHDDFWYGKHLLTYTRNGDTVDAQSLNFFNWPDDDLILALDECLTTVAGGWMILKYRRDSEENRKLLENAKDDLTNFLDAHISDIITISSIMPS